MEKQEFTLVAAQVPNSEVAQLDQKAAQLGINRSEFIRRAIRNAQVVRIETSVMQVQPMVAA